MERVGCSVAVIRPVLAAAVTVSTAMAQHAAAPPGPWWDDFPTVIQTGDAGKAARCHAAASLCGAADDPTWGIYNQRVRHASFPGRVEPLHAQGLKALTWIECFGTAQAHILQLRRQADGAWVGFPGQPDLARVFRNAWAWKQFDGTGEVRWAGAHNHFDPDDDFLGPYTRLHPRYGCPPFTYPDGRIAAGFIGSPAEPWTHRVYDAGCAKTVLGASFFDDGFAGGSVAGGGEAADLSSEVPDPGYTPEQWAALRRERLGSLGTVRFSIGKDTACPHWIDYLRGSIRQALDCGIDGVWADNFSPWDSLNATPLLKAFGEWSVAGFRGTIAQFPEARRQALGLGDPDSFDVRAYLRETCRAWGGVPEDLRHPVWRDRRWLDEPVWLAYLVYKRQVGTAALSTFYRTIKEEAAAAGKPDFLVMGNDIPMFALGWPRGDLDMVSTELSWGWSLSGGSRGLMPPPLGSYVPVYKLAREHARSRFVSIWMYVPEEQLGKSRIADVLYYQGLANHTLPMPHDPHRRDAGNEAVDAAFFRFVREAAPVFGGRLPVEEVGLYASSSSQLAAMTPRGTVDFDGQTHAFSFWGWGTALSWLHIPWRALPEWKLTPAELDPLAALIVPSAEVFPADDVPALEAWVRRGGLLVLAGDCGRRHGEAQYFARLPGQDSTLAALLEAAGEDRDMAVLGQGGVLRLPEDPGQRFYQARETRPGLLAPIAAAMDRIAARRGPFALTAPEVPWPVGLTLHADAAAKRLCIDINNTDIDLGTDTVKPPPPLRFAVRRPPFLGGDVRIRLRVLSPGPPPPVAWSDLGDAGLEFRVGPMDVYAALVLEPEEPLP